MLAGRALPSKLWLLDNPAQPGLFLSFLYSTPTIQRRTYVEAARNARRRKGFDVTHPSEPAASSDHGQDTLGQPSSGERDLLEAMERDQPPRVSSRGSRPDAQYGGLTSRSGSVRGRQMEGKHGGKQSREWRSDGEQDLLKAIIRDQQLRGEHGVDDFFDPMAPNQQRGVSPKGREHIVQDGSLNSRRAHATRLPVDISDRGQVSHERLPSGQQDLPGTLDRDQQSAVPSTDHRQDEQLAGFIRKLRLPDHAPSETSEHDMPRPLERGRQSGAPPRDSRHERQRGSHIRNPRGQDHVPFEQPEQNSEANLDVEGSTITPSERKVFEKLFALQKTVLEKDAGEGTTGRDVSAPQHRGGNSAAAEQPEPGLKTTTSAPRTGVKKGGRQQRSRPKPEFPPALRPMAEQARVRAHAYNERTLETRTREAAAQHHLTRLTELLNKCRTDVALWQTLHAHVLNRVAALELDPPATDAHHAAIRAWHALPKTPAEDPANKASVPDLPVMTAIFPVLLSTFMHLIRTAFPSSAPLGLALLPTLRKLGPSAFALGITTELYNAHMHLLYAKYTDLTAIVDTLAEMDKEVCVFDGATLDLLDRIAADGERMTRGRGGEGLRALWATEKMRTAVKALGGWRGVVEERRQEEALRKARESEILDEVRIAKGGVEEHVEEGGVSAAAAA